MAIQPHEIQEKLRHLLKRKTRDVVALEFHPHETRALRMIMKDGKCECAAAGRLPPADLSEPAALSLPDEFRAPYAALLFPGAQGVIKVLSMPGTDPLQTEQVRNGLGLEGQTDYRIGSQVLQTATRRSEELILAAALPESTARGLLAQVPLGRPAPLSIGLSPIAILNSFSMARLDPSVLECLVFIDTDSSFFVFCNGDVPILFRPVPLGSNAVLERLQKKLGLDVETAAGILEGGVVDMSSAVEDMARSLLRNLSLSRDFIERHANRSVSRCFLGGDPLITRDLHKLLEADLGLPIEEWNPFASLPNPGNLPQRSPWAYAATLGVCHSLLNAS